MKTTTVKTDKLRDTVEVIDLFEQSVVRVEDLKTQPWKLMCRRAVEMDDVFEDFVVVVSVLEGAAAVVEVHEDALLVVDMLEDKVVELQNTIDPRSPKSNGRYHTQHSRPPISK